MLPGGSDPEAQKNRQPSQQAAEVVDRGGEGRVGCVARGVGEAVAVHPVVGFEMTDARFDSGTALQVAFDRFGDAPLLAREVTLMSMI